MVLLTISEPPWGFWATIGFSLIIYISVMLLQIVATVALLAAAQIHSPRPDLLAVVERMDAQGLYLSLIICCINTPVFIALSAVVASMRRDVPVKEYLGFCPVAVRKIVLWCGVLALFIAGCDTITFLAKGPVVPDFMIRAYKSAYFPPLLWFAFTAAAPVSEEVLFRGFLFQGIWRSRLGGVGAVLISSLAWASTHIQYNIYGIMWIFFSGLLLGTARIRTRSLYAPIAMHSLMNVVATAQVAIYLRMH